ncbi:sensor histidine kinase [Caenimonas sp. SL110]|uniref:sensor histidine kinase n=1 Tax=Caenimonas sp. SL110 TaxID=1450524 RepID=UPI00069F1C2B|nr:sensor histidine kinase [Caenimonas sp. SL110]
MTTDTKQTPPIAQTGRAPAIEWLVRANSEISQWAASMSWWRLIVLFLVILIASSILGELLHLRHDSERVAVPPGKEGTVTIGGPNGVKITRGPKGAKIERNSKEGADAPNPGASSSGDSDNPLTIEIDEDEDGHFTNRRIITVQGLLGDLGGALMVIFFCYLVAAKIVVRKVAQADEKVRTAVDAAERETMERQLVQARLQVLQAQVEPHFLFNTLAAVDYLIETEPPRASKMQKALITYLRGALPQMREESSTVGREMRLIRSYLELIKMRIEDRLEVEIDVPEALEPAEFPPMMLQSLVENAIKHGIEPKPEGGKVRVAAGVSNAQLWVEVSDTGVGVPDGDILGGPTSGTGVGLQNIRERLAMLYPGKSQLMLVSDPATGTSLKITVPYRIGNERAGKAGRGTA